MSVTSEYQEKVSELIQQKFQQLEIKKEWASFTGFQKHYSPRVDIAVGPFSIVSGENKIGEYNDLVNQVDIRSFLMQLYDFHVVNIGDEILNEIQVPDFDELTMKNANARCFLSNEIENRNSKKHIMGSMVNAASLGRIGIGIALTEKTFNTFIRILNYLHFLKRVEKNTYNTTNFLILTKQQLMEVL